MIGRKRVPTLRATMKVIRRDQLKRRKARSSSVKTIRRVTWVSHAVSIWLVTSGESSFRHLVPRFLLNKCRKHTGERPFQCHCQRRFTRLDNLRQHAQTVHSNEDIPGDSLAAIGTRFQRQIRTDRVRTSVSRPRPSSLTSQNNGDNHGFNHSRTLSNSSFGSSAPFDLHPSDDPRRRPVSLTAAVVPAFDPSGTQNGPPYQFGSHLYTQSPDGYSTPNSIYSANSIQVTPDQSAANPALSNRPSTWGGRIPSRRLSSGLTQQHDYISSAPYSSSTASYMTSVASNTPTTRASNPSSYISPAPPGFTSPPSIYFQSCNPEPDLEQRRRTWHPSTWRRPPSGLSYSQTPDVPTHVPATPPTVGGMRLPGIDSFDLAGAQPLAPPRRAPSPMDLDEPSIAEVQPSLGSGPSRPPLVAQENSWDLMHNNLHKLDLTRAPPAKVAPAIMAHQQSHHPPISVSPAQQECVRSGAGMPVERPPAESISEDVAMTPRNRKRQAWYNGPLHASAASHGVESHRINGHPTSGGQATPTFAPPPPALVPYRPASSLSSATTEGYITSGTQRYSASTQASSFEDWRAKMSQSAVSSIR